ncbi:MAG: DUF4412 domain-containing protein [Candidatus Binatia bacterium]
MKTVSRWIGAALLLGASAAGAAGFEGTLKLRTVSVERAAADKLAKGGDVLAITPAQLLAAKDSGAVERESTVYVRGTTVRMDTPLEKNKDGYAIVDVDKGTTWFVVPSEKRYIEWSEADTKAMTEKMGQVETMMKERMGSLPPEQRKQVEAMLKNMKGVGSGDEPAPQVEIKALDKTQTVNGMPATAFEAKTGDETIVGWITQEQPELSQALRTVQQKMEKMTPAALRGRQAARNALSAKGFPVMVQTLDPQNYRVEEVLDVEAKPVSADQFTVPKDFARTTGRDAMKSMPQQ